MKKNLRRSVLIFLTLYMFIPLFLTRVLGIGIFRKGRITGEIAFTFDDGPDPVYTPQLLDLLKKHDVKATFFVLGFRANQYPDIIRRIHEDGHQIGIHNYSHRSNWLMMPWTIMNRHIKKSAIIIERITGTQPVCYRPPWGMINVFDFSFRKNYNIVLWSLMTGDWRSRVSRIHLKGRLLRNITDGSVILLHDSGDALGSNHDAPKYMIIALDDVIQEVKQRGFQCVRVDEMIASEKTLGGGQISSKMNIEQREG